MERRERTETRTTTTTREKRRREMRLMGEASCLTIKGTGPPENDLFQTFCTYRSPKFHSENIHVNSQNCVPTHIFAFLHANNFLKSTVNFIAQSGNSSRVSQMAQCQADFTKKMMTNASPLICILAAYCRFQKIICMQKYKNVCGHTVL